MLRSCEQTAAEDIDGRTASLSVRDGEEAWDRQRRLLGAGMQDTFSDYKRQGQTSLMDGSGGDSRAWCRRKRKQ